MLVDLFHMALASGYCRGTDYELLTDFHDLVLRTAVKTNGADKYFRTGLRWSFLCDLRMVLNFHVWSQPKQGMPFSLESKRIRPGWIQVSDEEYRIFRDTQMDFIFAGYLRPVNACPVHQHTDQFLFLRRYILFKVPWIRASRGIDRMGRMRLDVVIGTLSYLTLLDTWNTEAYLLFHAMVLDPWTHLVLAPRPYLKSCQIVDHPTFVDYQRDDVYFPSLNFPSFRLDNPRRIPDKVAFWCHPQQIAVVETDTFIYLYQVFRESEIRNITNSMIIPPKLTLPWDAGGREFVALQLFVNEWRRVKATRASDYEKFSEPGPFLDRILELLRRAHQEALAWNSPRNSFLVSRGLEPFPFDDSHLLTLNQCEKENLEKVLSMALGG